jgi:hypothetical protein
LVYETKGRAFESRQAHLKQPLFRGFVFRERAPDPLEGSHISIPSTNGLSRFDMTGHRMDGTGAGEVALTGSRIKAHLQGYGPDLTWFYDP